MANNKKVIFVNGTRYSGSTFFHLALANDPAGFAIGEVISLFHPTHINHLRSNLTCNCGDPSCTFWDRIKKRGEEHLYEAIFESDLSIDFIVDSSKNIIWFEKQSERLARQGIEAYHLAIWKTAQEFCYSLYKRDQPSIGAALREWAVTYRKQYSFINDWRSVKYANYAQDQSAVLKAACEYAGIPFFEGKERYWEKPQHTLGGNLKAKLQLFDRDSTGYQHVKQAGTTRTLTIAESNYRKTYYEAPNTQFLELYNQYLSENETDIDQLEAMLATYEVLNETSSVRRWPELQMTPIQMEIRRLRQYSRSQLGLMRYGIQNWQWERKIKA